jgi:hypothetical protein
VEGGGRGGGGGGGGGDGDDILNGPSLRTSHMRGLWWRL